MSLNALLNSGSAGKAVPAPGVRRVLRHVVEGPTKPVKVDPEVSNLPVRTNIPQGGVSHLNEEDTLAFSIVSKILLPKNRIERISILFQKLLLGKLSFPTVAKNISTILEICPTVHRIWQLVSNRQSAVNDPLFMKVSEIIRWFRSRGQPDSLLFSFVGYIATVRQHSVSPIKVCEELIKKRELMGNSVDSNRLIHFAVELLYLLPRAKHPMKRCYQVPENRPVLASFLSREFAPGPFTINKRYPDVSTFLMKNGKIKEHTGHRHASSRDTIFTPSHHQHLIPIGDGPYSVFLNFITKSLATGHEGGSRGHGSQHQEIQLPETRDIHDVLEQSEVVEHYVEAITRFDRDTNYVGHVVRTAGKSAYDKDTWDQIEPMLASEDVRGFVSDRCKGQLRRLEDAHRTARHVCEVFLETRPINAFLLQLRCPDFQQEVMFTCYLRDSDVAQYSKTVFTLYTSQRYPYIPFFFRNIMQLLPGADESMQVIGPMSLAVAFFYYSKLCQSIEPLLSGNGVECETYEAVFDVACEKVQQMFPDGESALRHRFLSDVLKSVTKNGLILDDLAYDVLDHFGRKAHCVAEIAPILARLNSACACLAKDHHWHLQYEMAKLFGLCSDQPEERFRSRFSLYHGRVAHVSGGKLFVINFGKGMDNMRITPL